MRCDDLARALSAAGDGQPLQGRARGHVDGCLRCQAELVQYRKLIKVLRTLRTEVLAPGPSLAADILEGLEHAGERSALRSLVAARRPPHRRDLALATAAAVGAGAIVVARRHIGWRPAEGGEGADRPGGLSLAGKRRGQ